MGIDQQVQAAALAAIRVIESNVPGLINARPKSAPHTTLAEVAATASAKTVALTAFEVIVEHQKLHLLKKRPRLDSVCTLEQMFKNARIWRKGSWTPHNSARQKPATLATRSNPPPTTTRS